MKRCFVIMPFASKDGKPAEQYWTDHFEKFLKPTIENIGDIEVIRSTAVSGNLMKNIIHELITADIVVADLTDTNVNVYYELGIRQSFKHSTITIAEKGTKLPFDVYQKGTIFYEQSPAGVTIFRERLVSTIKHCINNPNYCDSDILDYVKGKHSLYNIINQDIIAKKLNSLYIEYMTNKFEIDNILSLKKSDKINDPQTFFNLIHHTNMHHISLKNLITELYLDLDDLAIRNAYGYYYCLGQLNSIIYRYNNMIYSNSTETPLVLKKNLPDLYKVVFNQVDLVLDFQKLYLQEVSKSIDKLGLLYNPFKEKS